MRLEYKGCTATITEHEGYSSIDIYFGETAIYEGITEPNTGDATMNAKALIEDFINNLPTALSYTN